MGSDSIKPFLDAAISEDKCVFVLVKTSNPGSGELQDIVAGDRQVYEVVGLLPVFFQAHMMPLEELTMAPWPYLSKA